MAYRHFPGAPFLTCWCDGNNIYVREVSGQVREYACSLGVAIPEQITPFESPFALWCLKHKDILYVGRDDGTFSGFLPDGTLCRYGSWKYPWYREFRVIGQYCGKSARLDSSDRKTVYVCDKSKAFLLHKPWMEGTFQSLVAADMLCEMPELTIYGSEGKLDVDAAGTWVSTPGLERSDPAVQL